MKHIAAGLFAVLAAASLFNGEAGAATVDVTFLPPSLPVKQICISKREDSQIAEQWQHWNGASLPRRDPDSILSDARRLRDINAAANFDTVKRILDLLPPADPKKKGQDTTLEQIKLYVAAGRLGPLKDMGLVDSLLKAPASLTPRANYTLSQLYMSGMVLPHDEKRGLELLVSAGYGGYSDALLDLAKMTLAGNPVPNWNVEPDLAVIMAFGSLVGKLDPSICDRLNRIAREYESGAIVTKNASISEKWFRLSADLGDSDAAWKVASLHLQSEEVRKDNDVLLRYLDMAARRDVSAAKVELGRLYEVGALTPLDVTKAAAYYRDAGNDRNGRNGLVRLALMIMKRGEDWREPQEFAAVLRQLASLPDAPGWIYAKLARIVLDEKGRWAGEVEAQQLLEKGALLNDSNSQEMLAQILLSHRGNEADFQRAVEILTHVAESLGKRSAMTDLVDAYLCHAPNGTDDRLAAFWHENDIGTGNKSLVMKPADIERLVQEPDPIMVATLQTQALYGRPKSVAYYLDYLQRQGAAPEEISFWKERATETPKTRAAVLRLAYRAASGPAEKKRILDGLIELAEAKTANVGIDIGEIVLKDFPQDAKAAALAKKYLREAAQSGNGKALWMLTELDRGNAAAAAGLYGEFASVIDTRGDTPALLFAAKMNTDAKKRSDLLNRAVGAMVCDFDSVLSVASAYAGSGEVQQTEQWLHVGETLAAGNGWYHVALADARLKLQGNEKLARAVELYAIAMNMGEQSAPGRLLKLYGDRKSPVYSAPKAALMFKTLLARADVEQIADLLTRVGKAPPEIKNSVLADISVPELYRRPAEAGNTIAMREFGKLVRSGATEANPASATAWFMKAASQDDAESMVELAKAYAFGVDVEPSVSEAAAWLQKAAEKGNAEARQLLATMGSKEKVTQ
ncbi:hypothetical protein BH10PSE7_BH10PSE7_12770 [soil metagenome]